MSEPALTVTSAPSQAALDRVYEVFCDHIDLKICPGSSNQTLTQASNLSATQPGTNASEQRMTEAEAATFDPARARRQLFSPNTEEQPDPWLCISAYELTMLQMATPGRLKAFDRRLQAVYQENEVNSEQMESVFDASVGRWREVKEKHYPERLVDIGRKNGLSDTDATQLAQIMRGFTVEQGTQSQGLYASCKRAGLYDPECSRESQVGKSSLAQTTGEKLIELVESFDFSLKVLESDVKAQLKNSELARYGFGN